MKYEFLVIQQEEMIQINPVIQEKLKALPIYSAYPTLPLYGYQFEKTISVFFNSEAFFIEI